MCLRHTRFCDVLCNEIEDHASNQSKRKQSHRAPVLLVNDQLTNRRLEFQERVHATAEARATEGIRIVVHCDVNGTQAIIRIIIIIIALASCLQERYRNEIGGE